MKTISLITAIVPALVLGVSAQQAFQVPVIIVDKDGGYTRSFMIAATKTSFRFKATDVATDSEDRRFSDVASVYFLEPAALTEAKDLFDARKYGEAKPLFTKIKETYKPVIAAPGNPATVAGYYELECMRRGGDLEGLSTALQQFSKDPLLNENHLRQLELYVMWDAVRTESWDRLAILTQELDAARLAAGHRAQVAYCKGRAAEGLGKPEDALIAYATAMTADAGASDDVARQAALRILTIHSASDAVKTAIKNWGTKDENKNSKGYSDLIEAAAVAEMFQNIFGGGTPLPEEFAKLLNYRVKPEAPADA